MTPRDVLSVAEFRNGLAKYLALVASDRRVRVFVGSRRKPDAVVMSPSADVPPQIQERLLSAFTARAAQHILSDSDGTIGAVVGMTAGDVFAWLWRTNPDQAVYCIADMMADIHVHQPGANPSLGFADVLDGLERAMPPDFTASEFALFRAECVARVPNFYAQVNNPKI
jgi:hypothetical protein